MARNIGVLIRQRKLLPCPVHHRMLVSSSSHQTLTLSSIPSSTPSSSSSTPNLPFSTDYNYHSLIHSRSLHFMPPPPKPSESQSDLMISFPSNVVLCQFTGDYRSLENVVKSRLENYHKALDKVKNERISAVFFYTAPSCWRTTKYITNPIFFELCEQFRHITIYMVAQRQGGVGTGMTLDRLGVESPEFHFYLKGEKVDELTVASVPRLKRTLENVYNPSGMKKRRTRAKNDGVEVVPSRFPASSIPKVMEAVELLPGIGCDSNRWWFAKGLFVSQGKREMFSNLKDPAVKLEWLNREITEEE